MRRREQEKYGLTSYSGTTFRVIIRYWHDLFSRSNSGTTFFDGSDTGTTSAFPLRWHFLFFPPPPGCHLSLSLFSSSLFILSLVILVLFLSLICGCYSTAHLAFPPTLLRVNERLKLPQIDGEESNSIVPAEQLMEASANGTIGRGIRVEAIFEL